MGVVPAGECRRFLSVFGCVRLLYEIHVSQLIRAWCRVQKVKLEFLASYRCTPGVHRIVIILYEESNEMIKMMKDLGYIDEIASGFISISALINDLLTVSSVYCLLCNFIIA